MSYRDNAIECICVLAWSEKARRAYVEALRDYQRCGSPGIPLGSTDYQKEFKNGHRKDKRRKPLFRRAGR